MYTFSAHRITFVWQRNNEYSMNKIIKCLYMYTHGFPKIYLLIRRKNKDTFLLLGN